METPRGGRKAEGVKAGGSGKWEEKWRSVRKKEKRAKIGYMEMGKSSKDRDKECLFAETEMCHSQVRIGQINHKLQTIETKKISLSPYNDKR